MQASFSVSIHNLFSHTQEEIETLLIDPIFGTLILAFCGVVRIQSVH